MSETMKREEGTTIRACANCRNFEVLGEGYEIGRIEDTRYLESRCTALGWSVREHYLFPVNESRELRAQKPCPFWEPFL